MSQAAPRFDLSRRSGLIAGFGLGAAVATGQAPLGWAWFAFGAIALAIALLSACRDWRQAAWRGWALGTGHFAVALVWIVEPFMVDPVRHGWMAPFALFFMVGGLALFWAAAAGLAAALGRNTRQRAVFIVLFWTLAELARAHILTGFPWAMPGHIWIGLPQMQAAALFGAHGLTFLTLTAAALPTVFGAKRLALGAILGAALMSLPAIYAANRVPDGAAPLPDDPVTVRLIQPNAAQHEKWDPDLAPVFFDRQLDLTGAPTASDSAIPDVVIWPETAIPWLLEYAEPVFFQMSAAAGDAQVVTGLQRRDTEGWFNSLVVLDADGTVTSLYDKHHLVPFGEYIPFGDRAAKWGLFGLAAGDTGGYVSGSGAKLLDLGEAGTALPLICYEAIFPNDIARAMGRADWILHITNDAWFGQVSGPHQHLALARLRAVEQGLPLVRSANTGVSAAFDPYGRSLAEIPLGISGFIDTALPEPLSATPYVRFGDVPVIVALLVGLFGCVLLRHGSVAVDPTRKQE